MTFHTDVSAKDMKIFSSGLMTVDLQVLNNGTEVLVLDGHHHLEAIRHLHGKGVSRYIEQHSGFVSLYKKI